MQFLVGQAALNEKDYEKALGSFTRARDLTPSSKVPELDTISLVCRLLGCVSCCSRLESDIWMEFRLIATPYPSTNMRGAVSRMTEAAESLRGLLNEFGVEVAASETLSNWLQSAFFIDGYSNSVSLAISTDLSQTFPIIFRGRCVKHLGQLGDTAMDSTNYEEARILFGCVVS